jgi:hypothetical protein
VNAASSGKGRIRWLRILAGIGVIVFIAGRGGTTTVDCRFDPPKDLLGTPTETPLMVHEANSTLRYLTWGLFVGVFVFAGLGTLLILWGTVWRRARPA